MVGVARGMNVKEWSLRINSYNRGAGQGAGQGLGMRLECSSSTESWMPKTLPAFMHTTIFLIQQS